MRKKLITIGIAPLFATVAFAMTPTAAQAAFEPQIWSEGALQTLGESVPVISWGDLSLKGAAEITCHNVIGGQSENPLSGKAAVGTVDEFAAWGCVSNFACPAGTKPGVEPQNLPWPTHLFLSGTKNRSEATGVEVVIGCVVPPADHVTGTTFVTSAAKKQFPLAPEGSGANEKGSEALHPGKYFYDSGSGELEAKGSGGTVTGVTEGLLKTLGYNEQEHVYTCPTTAKCV